MFSNTKEQFQNTTTQRLDLENGSNEQYFNGILEERTAFFDKQIESISLEWLYILLFRNLSAFTHIKFLDFRRYFKKERSEIVVFLSGNSDETERMVALADYFYKELLGTFLKLFKSPLLAEFEKSYRTKPTF